MTTQDPQASPDSDREDEDLYGAAVSPAIGPLPAIYVPKLPGETGANAAHRNGTARAARLAGGWAAHLMSHLRHQIEGGKMSATPDELRYSNDHLWARTVDGTGLVRVGVTDFAQDSLGDVVEVTLPQPGDSITVGQACGDIESVKSVNDLVAPVSGTIRTRNEELGRTPELVNSDPYGQGWMFEAEADPASLTGQLADLMDARAYRDLTGA